MGEGAPEGEHDEIVLVRHLLDVVLLDDSNRLLREGAKCEWVSE